ncbi:hypothetical protein PVAG01_03312 [Phlyctema vagabunda]|uniref:Uncharacterized protein n=1 Tax=Phlyctema vagabunda TaxID=108571 RepID=A0ABR4PL22_9HELO
MSFFVDDSSKLKDEWIATVLRYSFSYPYLMYQLLALSAFHLSIKHPTRSNFYLTESGSLQAQALSIFNSSAPFFNAEDLIPAFLFSGGLGLHVFCDIFSAPSQDLNTFLDRLVQAIRLLRGVRALIGDSWEMIKNSDIKCLLHEDDEPDMGRGDEIIGAFEELRTDFSRSRTLPASDLKIYCEAIDRLIWAYRSRPPDFTADGPPNARMVTIWPITLSAEYTELLYARKPEALVVMAYFSILLHSRRVFWAVGDAGRSLLRAVDKYLGEEWAQWLKVPKDMVLSP